VLAALDAATRPEDGEGESGPLERAGGTQPSGRHRADRHRPTVVTVPSRLRGGRLGVSRSAVVGVIGVVLVLVLIGGVRMAVAVHDSRPEAIVRTPPRSALESAPATPAATPAGAAEATVLVVHVAGQVDRPGIVRLRPGDRVVDAVEAAGGATPEADLTAVNLARPVVDGEQVYVPLPGEVPPAPASPGAGPGVGGPAAPVAPGGFGQGTVDLNTADAAALESLPGVGPVLAERILQWRADHGRFTSVDELAEVSGIGDKLLARIRDRASVGP
jgi:competence protein ComEA